MNGPADPLVLSDFQSRNKERKIC